MSEFVDRESIGFTVEEFTKELEANFPAFVQNMNNLKVKPQSFPEWYEMFGRWLEVGTDMEDEYWGDE